MRFGMFEICKYECGLDDGAGSAGTDGAAAQRCQRLFEPHPIQHRPHEH